MADRVWDFINWRCRLQRYADARFFSGWITDISPGEVHVDLVSAGKMNDGDEFQIETSCRQSSMSCRVSLFRRVGDKAYFEVSEPMVMRAANPGGRRRVKNLAGTMNMPGVDLPIEIEVLDVGADGVGLLLPDRIDLRSRVSINFESPVGRLKGSGLIRYCRPDLVDPQFFRAGLEFSEESRPLEEFWERLLDEDLRPHKAA